MISPTEQTARAAEAPKIYLLNKTISIANAIKVATELNIYDQLIVHPEAHQDIFIAAARNLGKERIFLIEKETSEEKVKGVAAALQDSVYLRFKKDTPKDTMIAAAQALKNRVKFYFDINFPADTILAVAPIVVLSGGDFFFNGAMPEAIHSGFTIKLRQLLEAQQLAGKKRVSFFDGSDALTIIERNVIDALLSLSRDDSSLSLTTPGNTP